MELISFILHFDEYLIRAVEQLGAGVYALLFLIIFAETGLVVTPFLPGDSLLFAAGALAGNGTLNLWAVLGVLLPAAIIGDTVNYWVGTRIGSKVFKQRKSRIFKPEYLEKTQAYYDKHGGKTIIIARFVPIVRTFAPFVAGVGEMRYAKFLYYNVIGALLWVISLTLAGYFLGSLPFFQRHFEAVVLAIIGLSVLPGVIEFARHKHAARKQRRASYERLEQVFRKEELD